MLALASVAAPTQTRLGVFSGGWCRPARDPSRPPWARNLGPRAIISPLDNEVVVLGTSANLGDCEEQCEAKLGDNLACALWDGTGPAASCSCQSKAPEGASLYDETQFCWSPRSGVESTVYLDAKPVNCGEHVECCTPATCEAEGWDMDCISNSSAVPVPKGNSCGPGGEHEEFACCGPCESPPPHPDDDGGDSNAALIGGIVGGVGGALFLAALAYFLARRKRMSEPQTSTALPDFDVIDRNRDGKIDREEWRAAGGGGSQQADKAQGL